MENNFPKMEREVLKFWKENQIFEKSIAQRQRAPDFVFYEGPPTANAKPGIHHVLARIFKDIICRYKTMQGFKVERKAGWDTHGLPVELEIEKKLGFKTKRDIERYGIAKFNELCRKSVWQYKKDWEELTERIGFWLDLKNPYITYNPEYMETVWLILKRIWEQGLLYEDLKVVPYCPRCQTALSSHEVALGYKKITEPATFIKLKVKTTYPPAALPLKGWAPREKLKGTVKNSKLTKAYNLKPDIYLLVWTTTPWTLPGNVAVAVNPEFVYTKVRVDNEILILAKERIEACDIEGKILEEFKGKDLIGLKYQPLYPDFHTPEYESDKIYSVVEATFVSLEEGTGLVHIAPAFGEEDMELIKMQNAKCKMQKLPEFPILLNVNEEGRFKKDVKWVGAKVTDEKVNEEIIEDLKKRNLLFKKESYEHDYPFCWRCNAKLIYYAKKSWFIKMTHVRDALLKNNQQINWIPLHLKEGRFGEWLKEVKDWALSRERFWGTPLPIWRCQMGKSETRNPKPETNSKIKIQKSKKCDNVVVIGSRRDLLKQKFSTNKYFICRHGHSLRQIKNLASCWPEKIPFSLTEKGKKEVLRSAKKFGKIDLIFSSDLSRTKESAEIISKETGAKIIFDKRLREINVGIFNNQDPKLFWNYISKKKNFWLVKVSKGESLLATSKRIYNFVKEIDQKYEQKNILIVSHELPLTILEKTLEDLSLKEIIEWRRKNREKLIKTGELRKNEFKKLPLNEKMEIDFHRPYIDEVKFFCPKCNNLMERVPEVIDCWFDSGAMPFAQAHWPFAWAQSQTSNPAPVNGAGRGLKSQNLKPPDLFPADYISEGIDQTRGWFYTLLAISTLLSFGPSYKNVISLGLILDEKGEKMSKSKGNVVDSWQVIEKYGVDSLRWYFFTINQPADAKLFSEREVSKALKKFIMTLWNSYSFFATYTAKKSLKFKAKNSKPPRPTSPLAQSKAGGQLKTEKLLDRWIISRFNSLILDVTDSLDNYDITRAARQIENFVIEDFSQWYIRRSRPRFQKPKNKEEFQEASETLGFILLTLSQLSAPLIPFLSEEIYKNLSPKPYTIYPKNSVHLADWPKANKKFIDKNLEEEMAFVRKIVSLGLKARAEAKIKVRQPLRRLKVKTTYPPAALPPKGRAPREKLKVDKELLDLIKEEVNVKEIIFDVKIKEDIELDTKITPDLKEEGQIRDVIRHIQEMRKEASLTPRDKIKIAFSAPPNLIKLLLKNKAWILKETKAKDFLLKEKRAKETFDIEKNVDFGAQKLWLAIKKIQDL